jgi:hypothetical protein
MIPAAARLRAHNAEKRRKWHQTTIGTIAATASGIVAVLALSLVGHGSRPTLGPAPSLHCPAPSELIWNPRTETAHCDYVESDFDR